jgi:hypothetical protein
VRDRSITVFRSDLRQCDRQQLSERWYMKDSQKF